MNTVNDESHLEYVSLRDLIKMGERKLQPLLARAYKSPFYRDRWRAVGVHPDRVHGLEDLHLLPLVSRQELFEATRKKQNKIACSPVDIWFAGSSPANPYEWYPFSAKDFLGIGPMLARTGRIAGLRAGDIVLAIADTPPRISSGIPYLWTSLGVSGRLRLEFITASLDWYDTLGMTWINFIQRRRPTVLFASTQHAFALADKIHQDLGVQAREILTETRVGIFFGEPLGKDKARLMKAYALEPHEVYSPTEHMSFCTECSAHQGIHFWLDTGIPEIIPNGRQEAVPIWETSPGTIGELVITNFAECLPLIRYKTGELIFVEAFNDCVCGLTAPRITRLPKPAVDLAARP